jgi:hypothetical protein
MVTILPIHFGVSVRFYLRVGSSGTALFTQPFCALYEAHSNIAMPEMSRFFTLKQMMIPGCTWARSIARGCTPDRRIHEDHKAGRLAFRNAESTVNRRTVQATGSSGGVCCFLIYILLY